jgi:hypothetical protein
MEQFAKLLTSFAALVGAVAWPATLLVFIFVFKAEIKSGLSKAVFVLDRLKKVTLAGIALELDRVADAEAESGADKTGKITPLQIEAASRIAQQARDVSPDALVEELDKLCLQYDTLRRSLPSGRERTRAMTSVVVKMRALAPSLMSFLEKYKGSASPGRRLAAITMMQMDPRQSDINWLRDRFSSEHPFVFYHAALALQNVAATDEKTRDKVHFGEVVQQALAAVKAFDGVPDQNTIEILDSLLTDNP